MLNGQDIVKDSLLELCQSYFLEQGFGHQEVIEQCDLGDETRDFLIQIGELIGFPEIKEE